MESVVDERESGGRCAHSEPPPQDENTGRFPSQGELVSLASELDLRIEDLKRDHEGGVKAVGGEGGNGIAAQIEEMEAWLRSRGWESYNELFERVLEQAGPTGERECSCVGRMPFLLQKLVLRYSLQSRWDLRGTWPLLLLDNRKRRNNQKGRKIWSL
jgi:hypothetical protein